MKEEIFLSTNIRYLRKQKQISQEQMATDFKCSNTTISGWETGYRIPDSLDLPRLSKYFNVPLDDLITKDLRFENISNIGEEITREEFNKMVNELIDRCINMTEEDKIYYKRALDIKE